MYGMKIVLFIVVMIMRMWVIGGGKNFSFLIFKGIEYMGCNDFLEIKYFRKFWFIFFM